MIDRNLIKHFKAIQEQQLLQCQGKLINTKFTSRPGLAESNGPITDYNEIGQINAPKRKGSLDNSKSHFLEEKKMYSKVEEKRFRAMLDLLLKFREWEEEKLKVQLMQGTTE